MSFPAPNPFMCTFTTVSVFWCQIFLQIICLSFNAILDLFVFPGGQVGRIVVPRFWTRVGTPCHICPAQNATPATVSWNQTKLVPIPYQKKYGYKEDRLSRPRQVWTTSTGSGSSYDDLIQDFGVICFNNGIGSTAKDDWHAGRHSPDITVETALFLSRIFQVWLFGCAQEQSEEDLHFLKRLRMDHTNKI